MTAAGWSQSSVEICCLAVAAHRREDKTNDSSAFMNGEQSMDCLSRAIKEIKVFFRCFYDVMCSYQMVSHI